MRTGGVPFRAWAIRDGEDTPCWWTTTNQILFTRTSGLRETVRISELTWVAHGFADPGLYGLFEKKLLYNANGR